MKLLILTLMFCSGIAIAQEELGKRPGPAELIRQTIADEDTQWAKQQRYVCSYQIITRDHYDTGISTHAVEQSDEIVLLHGKQVRIVDSKTGKEVTGKKEKVVADSQMFSTWRDPLFESVLEHAEFSPQHFERDRAGRSVVVIEYRGDSAYHPTLDIDRIAQSLSGRIVIDPSEKVFVSITGNSDFDVVDEKRFLMVGRHPGGYRLGIPLLDYHTAFYETTYLPTTWSQARYRAVKNNRMALNHWLESLTRTFMQRISCKEYRATSTIVPGFSLPVPNEAAKPK